MLSKYSSDIDDNYLSDSSIQLNETGFSSLGSASSYSQLNFTESLLDTSSEAYSFKTYTDSCKSNGWTTYFNQDCTSDILTTNTYADAVQYDGLGYQFPLDIMAHFPNLSSFVGHVFFPLFSKIWIDFQNNVLLANGSTNRFQILLWFNNITSEIQRVLEALVNSSTRDEALDSQSRDMFSAFRILKEQIKEAHQAIQAIQAIEESLVAPNQDPTPIIWPPMEDTSISGMTNVLENPIQICQSMSFDDSKNEIQFSSGVEYPSNGVNIYNIQNSNPILATNSTGYPVPALDPSPTESCVSTPKALYIPNIIANDTGDTPVKKTTATYRSIQEHFARYPQVNNNASAPLPHVHPSWLHLSSGWSVPVTPSVEINNIKYMSLPASPTWKNENYFSQVPIQQDISSASCTTFPSSVDGSIIYSQESSNTSITLNQSTSPVSNYSSDDLFKDIEEESFRTSTLEESEDEYTLDEIMEEERVQPEITRPSKRIKKTRSGYHSETKSASSPSLAANTERKKPTRVISKKSTTNKGRGLSRRTATSYDSQTTHYLKSVFFDIYSQRDKLTKDQRRQVHKRTGLEPRKITYWFSNHKRRFCYALIKFKEARRLYKWIETYDDFINWRLSQGLPEEVHSSECEST
ncbi:hypothetical protein K501DRAFT_280068 [Backusella circina FSU 941]|nr:hypothetical protein K501DRAFT_280068 [Backusella circina FSU 941]